MAVLSSGTSAAADRNLHRPGDARSDALVAATIEGITRFGCALYQAGADPAHNAVLSPLGIGHACGMVRVGARGSTATQIDRTLGLPGTAGHAALSRLTWQILTGTHEARRKVTVPASPAPPTLRIASGLFIHHTRKVDPAYLRTIWTQYALGLHTVNFASARSTETINSWITDKTGGRIQQMIGPIDPRTQLMLRNTTYLSAPWREPFDANRTEPGSFTRADGSTVDVSFMRRTGRLRYATGPGWQAIELRYAGRRQAMWILLPTGETSVADVLTPEVLYTVSTTLEPAAVELALPQWSCVSHLDLVSALHELKLTELCTPGADLSGLSGVPGALWLDHAVHHASILVNEDGTDPPAQTACSPAAESVEPDVTARVDRPFGFAVIDLPSRLPLIVGHVADPSADG